ncbi:unnamed protein product, partial [Vitis vinifera]|uniref:Transmembrane protein n=1 Tax=Vitis vinifera TaxID=29760 RepID=D7U211_VITVI
MNNLVESQRKIEITLILSKMVDERRRLKPMKVKKYKEFRVFKPFSFSFLYLHLNPLIIETHESEEVWRVSSLQTLCIFILIFASPSSCIFVGLFFQPSNIGINGNESPEIS